MFVGPQLLLVWGLIVCGISSAAGRGHQHESLFFMLVIVFGNLSTDQFLVLTFLHIIIIMVNEFWRAGR